MHTPPFALSSHLSIIPTRLSLEYISAHNLVITLPPSSGAQAHYERHPPQLSKCSPPLLNLARRKRGAGPAPAFCAPYLQTLSRGPLWTRPNLMGVVSGLSIVGKRIDQDHAAAPPRLQPIVGTTAVGRAKNLPFSLSLSRGLTPGRPRLLQTRPTARAWSLVSQ